jgi:hypothetical protein
MPCQLDGETVIVETYLSVGHSASFIVGRRRELDDDQTRTRAFRFAVWGPSILANGWHPKDQPGPSAYLPARFEDVERRGLGSGPYTLLWLKGTASPPPGAWERSVQFTLSKVGLNGEEIAACLAILAKVSV